MTVLILLFNILPEVLDNATKQEKETTDLQDGKKGIKTLFIDNMIIHIENPTESIKKTVLTITEVSKITKIEEQYTKIRFASIY